LNRFFLGVLATSCSSLFCPWVLLWPHEAGHSVLPLEVFFESRSLQRAQSVSPFSSLPDSGPSLCPLPFFRAIERGARGAVRFWRPGGPPLAISTDSISLCPRLRLDCSRGGFLGGGRGGVLFFFFLFFFVFCGGFFGGFVVFFFFFVGCWWFFWCCWVLVTSL